MKELARFQLLADYAGKARIDSHIHKAGHLEGTEQIIDHLNLHDIDVGFLIPSALKEGKGSRKEDLPGPLKWWIGGWGNSRVGHLVSDYLIRPGAKGMFVQEPDNKGVIASAEDNPRRLMAWVWVNPQGEIQEALDETNDFLKHPNVVGAKLHFWIFPTGITNPTVMDIADIAQKAKKPILIDVGVNRGNMKDFDHFAKTHNTTPIIAAHLGSFLPDVLRAALDNDNVYLDMSGYPVTGENLKKILRLISADKIIFGSDEPGGISGSFVSQLQALHGARVTPRQRDLILTGNITRIVPKAAVLLEKRNS